MKKVILAIVGLLLVATIPVIACDDGPLGLTRGDHYEGQTVGSEWMAEWGPCSEYNYSLNADDPNLGQYSVEEYVDIGNGDSEEDHNLSGWGPIVVPTSGWGSHDGDLRTVWGPNSQVKTASLTMNIPEDPEGFNLGSTLTIRHLDGTANDAFDVYINDQYVYSHVDIHNNETWVVTVLDVSEYVVSEGDYEIEFRVTADAWAYQYAYGQVAVDWISLVADKECGSH